MGRPELRQDCADLEWFMQDRNVGCSRKLLEALIASHGPGSILEQDEPLPVAPPPEPPPIRLVVEDTSIQFSPHRVDIIKRMVCKHFSVTKDSIESASRKRGVVRPRQIAMYLARKHTNHSYPEIGRRFGHRDHTTIISAYRKIEGLISSDAKIAADVVELEAALS